MSLVLIYAICAVIAAVYCTYQVYKDCQRLTIADVCKSILSGIMWPAFAVALLICTAIDASSRIGNITIYKKHEQEKDSSGA